MLPFLSMNLVYTYYDYTTYAYWLYHAELLRMESRFEGQTISDEVKNYYTEQLFKINL